MASLASRRKRDDSDDEGHDDPELEAEMNRIMGRSGGQKRPEPKLSLLERAQLAQQRRMVGGGGVIAASTSSAPRASSRPTGGILAGIPTKSPSTKPKKAKSDGKEKKGDESDDDSEDDDDEEEEPDEKMRERLTYLASLSQLQQELKDGKSTPLLTAVNLNSRTTDAPADDVPVAPPMDDEIPAPPPMDEEIPVPPPVDDEIPIAPPMDDEIPIAPPVDDDTIPAPPPMDEDDDEIPIAPPMDVNDEIPQAPPMDDDTPVMSTTPSGPVNCEFCEEVHVATHRCVECEQNTCEHLGKIHLKARATAGHHIIPLNQSNLPLCRTHSLPLSLICHNDQQPVCVTCSTTTHQNHKVENLKDWTAKKRALLTNMVDKAEILIKKWNLARESAVLAKEELKNGEIVLEVKINAFFDKIQRTLQDRHEALLKEVRSLTQEKTLLAEARSESIKTQITGLTRIKNDIKDSLADSKTPKLFDLEKLLLNALEATQHTPTIDEKALMFVADENNMMQTISQIRLHQGPISKVATTTTGHKPETATAETKTHTSPSHVTFSHSHATTSAHTTSAHTTSAHTTSAHTTTTPVQTTPHVPATSPKSPKSTAHTPASSSAASTSSSAVSTTSSSVKSTTSTTTSTSAVDKKFETDYVSKLKWDQLCGSKSEELSITMPFGDTKEGAGVATGSIDNGRFWAYYTHDLQKNGNSRLWVADLKSGSTKSIDLPFNIENTYPLYDGKEFIYLFEDARYGFGRVNVDTLKFEQLEDTRYPVEPQCSACFQNGLLWRIQNRSLVSWDPKTQKWSSVHAILNNKMLMFADPFRTDRIWMLNNKGDFLSFDTQKSSLSRVSTTRYEQVVEGTFAGVLFPLEGKEIAIATQWGNGPWQLHNLSTKVWVDLNWAKVHDGGHISYNEQRKEIIYQIEGKNNLYRVSL